MFCIQEEALGTCKRLIPRPPQTLKSLNIHMVSLKGPSMVSCVLSRSLMTANTMTTSILVLFKKGQGTTNAAYFFHIYFG